MVHPRCNCYFSFWAIFALLLPKQPQKIKISIKWKNTWRYHHFTQMYQKSWSYAILFLRYMVHDILDYFLPFYCPNSPKIKICIQKKKQMETSTFYTSVPKIMIICHTVPEIYGAWRMELLFFCSAIFCPFTPVTALKKNISKKWKKPNNNNKSLEISSFYTQVYQKSWSYTILFLRYLVHDAWNCYFLFSAVFCSFTPVAALKKNISKKWK